jgi:ribosomal protein S20
MSQRAIVTSVDALDSFRSALLLYVSKARPTLEEVSSEVMRTRVWIESEKRTYWENQLRAAGRGLEEAQQALLGARMSNLRKESAAEVMAVQRAKRKKEEAEEKLRKVKQWNREFESRVQPLVKQMEKLHTLLAHDLIQAGAYLSQTIQTLDAYAAKGAPGPNAATPAEAPDGAETNPAKSETQA